MSELASENVAISSSEVREIKKRFGDKVLLMGHLEKDGSMLVPVDCIIEATRSLETRTLAEAAEIINNEQVVSMLQSGETLVERVGEARERRLREMIRRFQSQSDPGSSHKQWTEIEKEIFGVEYGD